MTKPKKLTQVCFTVDTEFSIAGNFSDPNLSPVAEPMVLGKIRDKEHGLGFLLDSFSDFGIKATFFVEALQTTYFGDEPMGSIVQRIASAGQDVQLHLHPCWLHYGDQSDAKPAPNDSCAGRSEAELDHFFRLGRDAFARWGLPTPIAVRPGNFQVDANFYRAAAKSGIVISSSVALAAYRPHEEELKLVGGRLRFGQVLEFPVCCYNYQLGTKKRLRILSITACSRAELIAVLCQAHDRGISPVVILTHPQEFIKRKDYRYRQIRRNRVNQGRLRAVLRFLHGNRDKFHTVPICQLRDDGPDIGTREDCAMSVASRIGVMRMVENGINDRLWWL